MRIDELEGAGIEENPVDRCYRCKRYLFRELQKEAELLGVSRILEGTNEDDLHVYRPGIRAVRELGIVSPLADAGLTKSGVRNTGSLCQGSRLLRVLQPDSPTGSGLHMKLCVR